jgi:phenylalanyl-tRNA synthetase beta chain
MEYSLVNLKPFVNFKNVTLTTFVNTLNLIGLEIDDLKFNTFDTQFNKKNIILILKIPANREDLLNENLLIQEFSTIFLFDLYNSWEIIKKKYHFLLKQKYSFYKSIEILKKSSNIPYLGSYIINIKNFRNNFSSVWISNKLKNLGIESTTPLNNLINLILSEWGQQINIVLTNNNLKTNSYYFECSTETKSIKLKDFNEFDLKPGTIILKNTENEMISIIGMIQNSFNESNFQDFLIEATFYDIHENPLSLNTLNTKLSLRYLRRTFFENFKYSLQRLLSLLEIVHYCNVNSIQYLINDNEINLKTNKIIRLPKKFFSNFLNIKEYNPLIFKKLGFKIICNTSKELYCLIPNTRKDLDRPIDIIEEYAKYVGYDNFKSIFPVKQTYLKNNKILLNQYLKNFLINHSFNEIITNSIISETKKNNNSILLNNPLNSELGILRSSLIPNLIEIFQKNLGTMNVNRLKFFEIGRIFKLEDSNLLEEENLSAIFQLENSKQYSQEIAEWFIHKGFVEHLLRSLDITSVKFEKIRDNKNFYHPTRSSVILYQNQCIGYLGELHPDYRKKFNVKLNKTFLLELNINKLKSKKLNSQIKVYKEYSKYPTITKDISLLINKNIDILNLKEFIENRLINLKSVSFFDLYSKNENFVSLGIRLEFQSLSQTLKTEEIEARIQSLIESLSNTFALQMTK